MARCNLTERIIIEKYSEMQNENGFTEELWSEYYKCWSGFKGIKGSEFISAKASNSEDIVTFTIRYCNKSKALLAPGASKIYRIFYNYNYYNLEYANDYNNLHEFIDLKCKSVC